MISLMIDDEVQGLGTTSFGGRPVKNIGSNFEWPSCRSCKLPMQFLGKIVTDKGLEQIFMCQNNPGCCDEWEADGGANKVVITKPESLEAVDSPSNGEVGRNCEYGARVVQYNSNEYDEARSGWANETGKSPRAVLGQLYGHPSWLQNEETPNCDCCNQPMRFVAQLEQGPQWETEMNFGGGGCAYLFDCSCEGSAKFLWQC